MRSARSAFEVRVLTRDVSIFILLYMNRFLSVLLLLFLTSCSTKRAVVDVNDDQPTFRKKVVKRGRRSSIRKGRNARRGKATSKSRRGKASKSRRRRR